MSRIVRRSAAARRLELLPHGGARLRVEARRRLVEEENLGTVDETHRHVESPLHSARVRLHERVRLVGETERLEQVGGAPLEVGAAHALQATLEDQVLAPRRLAVDARGLRDVPDRAPHGSRFASDVVACDGRAPGIGPRQRREDADGRRLSGSVRAEQPEDLSLGDRETDPVERLDCPSVGLLEAVDDDRVHRSSVPAAAVDVRPGGPFSAVRRSRRSDRGGGLDLVGRNRARQIAREHERAEGEERGEQ